MNLTVEASAAVITLRVESWAGGEPHREAVGSSSGLISMSKRVEDLGGVLAHAGDRAYFTVVATIPTGDVASIREENHGAGTGFGA